MRITDTRVQIDASSDVSALVVHPRDARAAFSFAHGAGAGMRHPFMAAFAGGLADRGVATLRFQFPWMEKGGGRPDSPAVATATVRAACIVAGRAFEGLPLFAGGKSFGGRMTSQAQADAPLPGVHGIAFVGFPLHPAKQPATGRAAHLSAIAIPLLFLQGTRDDLADATLIGGVAESLGQRATLAFFDDADHAFHVRKKSGGDDARTLAAMLDAMVDWVDRVVAGS